MDPKFLNHVRILRATELFVAKYNGVIKSVTNDDKSYCIF